MRVSKREKERKRRQRATERTTILVLNTLFKKKEEEDIGVYFNSTVHYGETKSRRAIIRPLRER